MKTIGIAAHSFEGGTLCLLTACREGGRLLGPHLHPRIVLSAVPMGWSMPGWESGDHGPVAGFLREGVESVAAGGADFYVCPDNTAHIVLEQIAAELPIPGLHIADVVCSEIVSRGWSRVGLLGTDWTMTGAVYPGRLDEREIDCLVPAEETRRRLDAAIFEELCQGIFEPSTTTSFLEAIDDLRERGAEGVILGCTEIPLIVNDESSSLPTVDSTRLLARTAVALALDERPLSVEEGWLRIDRR